MPEATTLYVMVSIVVAGLLVWVAVVLATAKTPWARGPLEPVGGGLAPLPEVGSAMMTGAHLPLAEIDSSVNVDDTARATPVALSDGRTRAVDATRGGDTTSTATAPDGAQVTMQEIRVGWLGAEDSVPQYVRRSKEEARLRAEEVLAKVRASEDFSALQREYDDPRLVEATPTRLAHAQKMLERAHALATNETSELIETAAGFCIVKRLPSNDPA